ncbi:hypothetical protein [Vibrio phage vB_VpaP_SJSY21]|nr:hypothetical protein [Vibrio phage vB_VpaP_SJSY21]
MKFKIYNLEKGYKEDSKWWVLDPDDSSDEKGAYVFDSDNPSDMENIVNDFSKLRNRVKIVNA